MLNESVTLVFNVCYFCFFLSLLCVDLGVCGVFCHGEGLVVDFFFIFLAVCSGDRYGDCSIGTQHRVLVFCFSWHMGYSGPFPSLF